MKDEVAKKIITLSRNIQISADDLVANSLVSNMDVEQIKGFAELIEEVVIGDWLDS